MNSIFNHSTHSSGLRLASCEMLHAQTVTLCVTVDVGARWERDGEGGLSHFLEHMAFKGTATRSAQDIAMEMDAVGGQLNAYTSVEHTVYYAKVLPKHVPLAVGILCDIVQNSTLDTDEMERERGVILQEIAMHYDTPEDVVFDDFTETAYPQQAIGKPILGLVETIAHVSRERLECYMRKHYHPEVMVFSAAGAITHEALEKEIAKHWHQTSESSREGMVPASYASGERLTERALEQVQLVHGWPGVSRHDDNYFTMQLLTTLLGGGMSSRLFQEVREKRGLAYTISCFSHVFNDAGLVGVYAGTSEADAAELHDVVHAEMQRIQKEMVSDEELERAKQQCIAGLLMSCESTTSLAEWVGRHVLLYGKIHTADEMIADINAVSPDHIQQFAQSVFAQPSVTTALGPCAPLRQHVGRHVA